MYPELGVLRLHQTNGEFKALRRAEADLRKQLSTVKNDPFADKTTFLDRTIAFGSRVTALMGLSNDDPIPYNQALREQFRQLRDTEEWKSKKQRPNYTSLGLNVRTLQNAGLIPHDVEAFKNTGDQHKEFRELHEAADCGVQGC